MRGRARAPASAISRRASARWRSPSPTACRAHVAKRLGLSVNTVSTVARRVYRKLGVTNQAGLAARLAGAARKELGEPA